MNENVYSPSHDASDASILKRNLTCMYKHL